MIGQASASAFKYAQIVIVFAAALLFAPLAARADAPTRPNIVILLADDLGYGDLACQNPDGKIPTPNLDRLASQGMRFTDAHSSAALCSPSRFVPC